MSLQKAYRIGNVFPSINDVLDLHITKESEKYLAHLSNLCLAFYLCLLFNKNNENTFELKKTKALVLNALSLKDLRHIHEVFILITSEETRVLRLEIKIKNIMNEKMKTIKKEKVKKIKENCWKLSQDIDKVDNEINNSKGKWYLRFLRNAKMNCLQFCLESISCYQLTIGTSGFLSLLQRRNLSENTVNVLTLCLFQW